MRAWPSLSCAHAALQVLIVEKLKIAKEFYFAILMDRTYQVRHLVTASLYLILLQGPVVVVSTHGGMDIESVAARDPAAILKFPVSLEHGLQTSKHSQSPLTQ